MLNQHIHKLGEAKIGDTVQVPIPDVDRGPGDLINILAYILDTNKSNMTYRLGTKHGIISGWDTRNKFHICKQKLLCLESLDLSKESSLREINSLNSISVGQGFLKCNCSGKCERNCTCKRTNLNYTQDYFSTFINLRKIAKHILNFTSHIKGIAINKKAKAKFNKEKRRNPTMSKIETPRGEKRRGDEDDEKKTKKLIRDEQNEVGNDKNTTPKESQIPKPMPKRNIRKSTSELKKILCS
ncbi:unnamed protein product [Brachionus calyciflorus]|uniref:Uncharacterized protein n=1 Tax=Brachionus calyciflorus TaxID=104777 RepID=A0A814I0V8_9BILA|nr:unnamed protein product [Brachionus calyciflorus]